MLNFAQEQIDTEKDANDHEAGKKKRFCIDNRPSDDPATTQFCGRWNTVGKHTC